ncbi:MAG TPA: hypothetical protein VFS34_06540 [Thermoanaerobaculia bacterium]|nr:hypothetical protein [Thermoanaerobaculia bacterium]
MRAGAAWRERLHLGNAAVIAALGGVLAWRGTTLGSVPLLLMAGAFVGYGVFRFAAWRKARS